MGTVFSSFVKTSPPHDGIIRTGYADVAIPSPAAYGHNLYSFLISQEEWKKAKKLGNSAFIDSSTDTHTTFAELETKVANLATGLKQRFAFGPGKTLAIMAPNSASYASYWMAAAAAGGTVTMINPAYTAPEVAHQLRDSRAILLVVPSSHLATAQTALKEAEAEDEQKHQQLCTDILVLESEEEAAILLSGAKGVAQMEGGVFIPVAVDAMEEVVALPYSSGTTGLPKGVMLTHHNIVANLCQITGGTNISGIEPSDHALGLLPFYHIYGMIVCMVAVLLRGGTSVTLPAFNPQLFLHALEHYKIKNGFLAPPLINFLAKHPVVNPDKIFLTDIISGAAPLGEKLAAACAERLPSLKSMRQGYGMTELSPVSHLSPFGSSKYGSIGKLIPNMECKLLAMEEEEEEKGKKGGGGGKRGEVVVRGPNVMKGYLRNEEATKNCLDEEGWMRTGDVAMVGGGEGRGEGREGGGREGGGGKGREGGGGRGRGR